MKKAHNRLLAAIAILDVAVITVTACFTQGCKSTPTETDTLSKQFEADWLRTNTVPLKKY